MIIYRATQRARHVTLNVYVSCALNFLENDLKDSDFKNASATATFCKRFNDIFDLLNVKHKL